MRIMVTAKSNPNGGVRRGRACTQATGNPLEDMANSKAQGLSAGATPSRARTVIAAQPIAIPEANTGARRRNGSPRSVQSSSPRSSSSYASSSKSSPNRASPSTNGLFYAGAKFSEAPAATSLPKPPSHWTNNSTIHHQKDQFQDISNQLKMLLNIKAWECTKSSCSNGTFLNRPTTVHIPSSIWHHSPTPTNLALPSSPPYIILQRKTNKIRKEQARTVHSLKTLVNFWNGFWNNGWRFKIYLCNIYLLPPDPPYLYAYYLNIWGFPFQKQTRRNERCFFLFL